MNEKREKILQSQGPDITLVVHGTKPLRHYDITCTKGVGGVRSQTINAGRVSKPHREGSGENELRQNELIS